MYVCACCFVVVADEAFGIAVVVPTRFVVSHLVYY